MPELLVRPSLETDALFENESQLTRDRVLARYFTPKSPEQIVGERVIDEILTYGNEGKLALIGPTSSFIMPQIRRTYDGNHIEQLGRHICTNPEGQLQNGATALIDQDHIEGYLRDLNEFFGSNINLEDLRWHDEFGGYLITIFGHNRQLGIGSYNRQQNGHPDHGARFMAKVVENPPFWRVLGMQAAENTGLLPNMWERSRSIVAYINLRSQDGIPPSQQEVADLFGVDPDQVWRAQRFERLPEAIKDLVIHGNLAFSGAIELDRLEGFYDEPFILQLAKEFDNNRSSKDQIVKKISLLLILNDLTPAARALFDSGGLTLPEARELQILKQIGISDDRINELIVWIGLNKPKLAELRNKIADIVKSVAKGEVSLYGEVQASSTDENRQYALESWMAKQAGDDISRQTTQIINDVRRLARAINKGVVPEDVAKKHLVGTQLMSLLEEMLSEMRKGRNYSLDERVVEALGSLASSELAGANGDGERELAKVRAIFEVRELNKTSQEALFA